MKRALPWLLTAALLAAAWLVAFATPDDSASVEPFVVPAAIGEEAVGREFALTVQQVRISDGVNAPNGWSADGTWLLVDVDARSTLEQTGSLLGGAELTIGDRSFRASERMPSMFREQVVTGVSRTGMLAFELPGDVLTGTGVLRLSLDDDTRADSVAELRIDLDELERVSDAEIVATDWTNP